MLPPNVLKRVLEELEQLEERRGLLGTFIANMPDTVSKGHAKLLKKQCKVMREYADILYQRTIEP